MNPRLRFLAVTVVFSCAVCFVSATAINAEEESPAVTLRAAEGAALKAQDEEMTKGSEDKTPQAEVSDERQQRAKRLMGLAEASQHAYEDGLGSLMQELEMESAGKVIEPQPAESGNSFVNTEMVTASAEAAKPDVESSSPPEIAAPSEAPAAARQVQAVPVNPFGLSWPFPKVIENAFDRSRMEERWIEKADETVREYAKLISERMEKMNEWYGPDSAAKTVRTALRSRDVRDDRIVAGAEQWSVYLSHVWSEVMRMMYEQAVTELTLTGYRLRSRPGLVEPNLPHLEHWIVLWDQTESRLQKLFAEAIEDAGDISLLYAQSFQLRDQYARQTDPKQRRSRNSERIQDGAWKEIDSQREGVERELAERLEEILTTVQSRPSFEVGGRESEAAMTAFAGVDEDKKYALRKALQRAAEEDAEAIRAGQRAERVAEKRPVFKKNYEKAIQAREQAYRYYLRRREMNAWDAAEERYAYDKAAKEAAAAAEDYRAQLDKEADVEKEVNRLRLEAKTAWEDYRRLCQ